MTTPTQVASLFNSLLGGGGTFGQPAPAFQPGGGLLDTLRGKSPGGSLLSTLAQGNNFGAPSIGPTGPQVNEAPSVDPKLLGEENPALQAIKAEDERPTGIGGFFGNLDSTLSSPSKTLGIGLLGQIDPRLSLLGLGLGGLLGNNRVFGG